MRELQNIDPRQVEFFLQQPGIVRRLGSGDASRMSTYVEGERAKTGQVRAGNVYLSVSKEFVKREDWEKLTPRERKLLQELGVEKFNTRMENTVQIGGTWYGSKTAVFRVLGAIKDGYTTHEELEQVTGLTRAEIDKGVKALVEGGYLKKPGSLTPTQEVAPTITGSKSTRRSLGVRSGRLRIRGGIIT